MVHGRWYPCGRRQTVPRASHSVGESGGEMREGGESTKTFRDWKYTIPTHPTDDLNPSVSPDVILLHVPVLAPSLYWTHCWKPQQVFPVFWFFNHFTCASYILSLRLIQNSLPQGLGSKISPHAKKLGSVRWQSLKSPRKCSICCNVHVWMVKVYNSMLCITYLFTQINFSVNYIDWLSAAN